MNKYLIGYVARTSTDKKIVNGNTTYKSENYPLDVNDIHDILNYLSPDGWLDNITITMIYKLGDK